MTTAERRQHMFELVDDHDAFLGNHAPGDEVRAVIKALDETIERLERERDDMEDNFTNACTLAALEHGHMRDERDTVQADLTATQAKLVEAVTALEWLSDKGRYDKTVTTYASAALASMEPDSDG